MTEKLRSPRSWAALRQAILSDYPTATDDGPDSLRLVLAARGGAVRVGLRIRATTAYGEPVVVVAADLGIATALDPLDALVLNAMLVYGALAAREGILELRAVLDFAQHGWPRVELAMRKLAAEAAELKARLSVPAAPTAYNAGAFAHLVD